MDYQRILDSFQKRRERVIQMDKDGIPHSDIARRMKVSRARVWQIVTNNGRIPLVRSKNAANAR